MSTLKKHTFRSKKYLEDRKLISVLIFITGRANIGSDVLVLHHYDMFPLSKLANHTTVS